MWKALSIEDYPLKIEQQNTCDRNVSTRAASRGRPCEIGMSTLTQNTCISDAIRLWNLAPTNVTCSNTVYQAKKEIKMFVKNLPI